MPKWLFPTNTNNDGRTTFNNETKATMALNVNDGAAGERHKLNMTS